MDPRWPRVSYFGEILGIIAYLHTRRGLDDNPSNPPSRISAFNHYADLRNSRAELTNERKRELQKSAATTPDIRIDICPSYCTALIMSKIGRYIATTMPPTITPKNTIIIGSNADNSPLTAASTSSS